MEDSLGNNAEVAVVGFARRLYASRSRDGEDQLAGLLHPRVAIRPLLAPDRELHGEGELRRFLAAEVEPRTVFDAHASHFMPLDEQRVVVEGRVRYSEHGEGGMTLKDSPFIVLLEFEEGQLLRSEPVAGVAEARQLAEERDAAGAVNRRTG